MTDKTAIVYARVSTGEQAKGFSIDAQFTEIKKYCRSKSIKILKRYDDAMSGKKLTERTGLMSLLAEIENLKPHLVISTESDRISRNTFQFGWIDTHLSMKGVKLLLVNEKQADSPFEKAFLRIRAVFSEFETDLRQWRINRGREKALKHHRFMNRPPFGYKTEGKVVVYHQDEISTVKEIFKGFIVGRSIKSLSRKHGKSPSSIRYILSNRFYADPKLNGSHPIAISMDDFDVSRKRLINNKQNHHP